ncbi:MAG: hypothetical protein KF872_06090 [Chitinophagales bacterium]|nr:hypothetical protein [Chitinophagales bacterium]
MVSTIIERSGGNRTLWLHSSFVQDKLMLDNNKIYVYKSRWKAKKIEGNWYFNYDEIPNRAPNFYRDMLPGVADLLGFDKPKEAVSERLGDRLSLHVAQKVDTADVAYYVKTHSVSPETALQLAEAKAWLDTLLVLTKTNEKILLGFEKIKDVYAAAISVLSQKKLKGLKVTNELSLRRKVAEYAQVLPELRIRYFVHGQANNQNAAIIGKIKIYHPETGEEMYFDVHLALIYSLYLNTGFGNKLFKTTIYKEYEAEILENGLQPLSYSSLCKRTHQFNIRSLMSVERDGNKHFNDNYLPYVSAERLQLSNTMWGGDGSSTKLLYKTDAGTVRSLMCYRVADIASRKVLGWHFYEGGKAQRGESAETILKALKMAYKNAGVFACEFITDNGGGHGEAEFKTAAKMLFQKHTTITPGNSQENPTENIIKSMNNFGRTYRNWGGSSWGANDAANLPNYDNINVSELPDKESAYLQALQWIEGYNNTKGADGLTPNERYEINKNNRAKAITETTYRFVFGNKTRVDVSYMRGFVNVEFRGVKLQYTIPNYNVIIDEIAKKTGYKGTMDVAIYFDEAAADLYSLDNQYIVSCPITQKAHKSEYEAFNGSWANHRDLKERKSEFKERAEGLINAVAQSMEAARYELLAKQKSVVKDDWEEVNTSQLPMNRTESNEAAEEAKEVSPKNKGEMSIEELAEHQMYFGM